MIADHVGISIRMSGLGGQGVVTAAHILGAAAHREGLRTTVNPFFGAEKRLAPAESYVRIATEPIYERGEALFPDIIMVFHPHVITAGKSYTMPFFDGLVRGGTLIINNDGPIGLDDEQWARLADIEAQLHYIPATRLAQEISGTELSTNIAMLGGLYGIRELTSMESLTFAMTERFGGGKFIASGTTAVLDDAVKERFGKISKMIEKNVELVEAAKKAVVRYPIGPEVVSHS